MPIDDLFDEARRQLDVCNACRYCEGYCAVFPALERRVLLTDADIGQLANLCHDCRACFQACMYAPPHEFAVNPPAILSAVRLRSSHEYIWPRSIPHALAGWRGTALGLAISVAAVFAIAVAVSGPRRLLMAPGAPESPYTVIPYPVLLILLLLPAAGALAVMIRAAIRYWCDVGGTAAAVSPAVIMRATWAAISLRNLRGGGDDCYYPRDAESSPARRHLHGLLVAGLLLCVISTVSAAVLQDIVGIAPPYPVLSVPVLAGTAGGVGIAAGCAGLLWLKVRSSRLTATAQMTIKDYGLLVALLFLAVSGLGVLLARTTAAFGIVFLIHLAAIVMSFAMAPYSKLTHAVFRFLALVKDEAEASSGQAGRRAAERAASGAIPGAQPE